jgi:predicted lipoprotein
MDSWPVNRNDLDSLLKGSRPFDSTYIAALPQTLKGFHALEYLVFGTNGNRMYNTYNQREKDYMLALAANLQNNALLMKNAWNPADKGSFGAQMCTAGAIGNVQYGSEGLALQELATGMADIVEEVGSEKMQVPFVQKDSLLEESHFSRNSFADFTNNIKGVKNAYLGKYTSSGTGMNTIVSTYNKALDTKLQQQMDNAINVFSSFSVPFGDAIYTQPAAIQNAQNVLDQLHTTLEDELVPLIKAHVK